jgi:hypothetical protein
VRPVVRCGPGMVLGAPRETEVGHAHEVCAITAVVAAQHHVLGLEVAVQDAGSVGGREPAPGEQHDPQHLRPAMPGLHPTPQRGPFDALHRDEDRVAARAHVVHGHDVGMIEPRECLAFAHQSCRSVVVRSRRRGRPWPQQLDRDVAVELGIIGCVHGRHRTATEHLEDDVATESRSTTQRWGRGCRCRRVGGRCVSEQALVHVVAHPREVECTQRIDAHGLGRIETTCVAARNVRHLGSQHQDTRYLVRTIAADPGCSTGLVMGLVMGLRTELRRR